MSIEKLSRFISAFSVGGTTQPTKSQSTEAAPPPSAEAVQFADDFGAGEVEDESERQARVARIKSEVASGAYQVNSQKVAESVARELFA